MVQITLERDEALMLREIVSAYLSDLRMEIADTDRLDFREPLKKKEVLLKNLLKVLPKEER